MDVTIRPESEEMRSLGEIVPDNDDEKENPSGTSMMTPKERRKAIAVLW